MTSLCVFQVPAKATAGTGSVRASQREPDLWSRVFLVLPRPLEPRRGLLPPRPDAVPPRLQLHGKIPAVLRG